MKKGSWSVDAEASSSSLPPLPPPPPPLSPSISRHMDSSDLEGDLISSLDRRKMYREVTLSIRSGIRDATSETSFLRVRGLQVLLKALQSISKNDTTIGLFHQSQSIPQLQGVLSVYYCCHLSLIEFRV